MTQTTQHTRAAAALTLLFILLSALQALAQPAQVDGLIKTRNGDTMLLQTAELQSLTLILTDTTKVDQIKGAFKAQRKQMLVAAPVPGLAVQIEGVYDDKHQLTAGNLMG